MYEAFYGLKERPFTLLPDPEYLYLSPAHKLARAYLDYGIKQRLGFVVLTGEIGTGKTTLIKSLLKSREGKQRLGVLYQTSFEAEDLLELLLREFGIRGNYPSRAARLSAFNQFLVTAYRRSEHVVLIIDEAQNLGPEALEEIRLLSNLQADKEPLLQVIIVGQPALRDRLRQPGLRQLAQRVAVHYHLRPLDLEETKEYIQFRLARAGGSNIFTDAAIEKLHEYTRGVPRRLNSWCDLALVAGFAEGHKVIDGDFIDVVITAQGGALEGPDLEGPALEEPAPGSQPTTAPALEGGNNWKRDFAELSGRLNRLEGLMIELTSQMVPVLAKLIAPPASEAVSLEELADLSLEPSGETSPQPPPTSATKSWWSRFRKN
jgi:general secretion pathway protein A